MSQNVAPGVDPSGIPIGGRFCVGAWDAGQLGEIVSIQVRSKSASLPNGGSIPPAPKNDSARRVDAPSETQNFSTFRASRQDTLMHRSAPLRLKPIPRSADAAIAFQASIREIGVMRRVAR